MKYRPFPQKVCVLVSQDKSVYVCLCEHVHAPLFLVMLNVSVAFVQEQRLLLVQ